MRKPNAVLALIKKLKLYIIPIKSKKRLIITPAILDKTKSGKETSLVNELENK
jgi:hypothetical protein